MPKSSLLDTALGILVIIPLWIKVKGHGGMLEPPMRSLAWRYGFDSPVNYDWNALYCGGYNVFKESGGKCGLCGDPYNGPFENDRGGPYDTGVIVRHYPARLDVIDVKFEITAFHKGYVSFKLCPNNEMVLTKACFDRQPLMIKEGQENGDPYKFYPTGMGLHEVKVELPGASYVTDACSSGHTLQEITKVKVKADSDVWAAVYRKRLSTAPTSASGARLTAFQFTMILSHQKKYWLYLTPRDNKMD